MLILKKDLQIGGIYHVLPPSEFRVIFSLHCYCDNDGIVRKATGYGYNLKDLSGMVGVNYRTLKGALSSLSNKHLIEIGKLGEIKVIHFIKESNIDC